MSVRLYDEALLNKLKSWTTDTASQVYSTDNTNTLFSIIGDQNKDKPIKLPIIVIKRLGGFRIKNETKVPRTYDGKTIENYLDKSTMLNVIPIDITYQIDIYARKQEECDEIVRNLIFNFVIFPDLNIELPYYGGQIQHKSYLKLVDEVYDNSDIPERLNFGQFTRFSLGIEVDRAFLFDIRERDNYSIDISVRTN